MLRALPFLIVVGLSVYAFIDVLRTTPEVIRHGRRSMWIILTLVPAFGAALWFLLGRPARSSEAPPPGRNTPRRAKTSQRAPDDDPAFLRRLDEEVWIQKRNQARAAGKQPGAGTHPGPGESPGTGNPTAAGKPPETHEPPTGGAEAATSDGEPDDDRTRGSGGDGTTPEERGEERHEERGGEHRDGDTGG